jgi:insulysin
VTLLTFFLAPYLFYSPMGNASPRASVLTRWSRSFKFKIFSFLLPYRLYSDIVKDSLTEFAYDADLAGLSYSFLPHSMGLYVSMNGYNDKMTVLVGHVLEKVKGLAVDPQRLAVIKDQVSTSDIAIECGCCN